MGLLNTVLLVYFAVVVRTGQMLDFECYPNSTLKVENPGNYSSVFASNSAQICTTTWTQGKTHVYVNNCRIGDDILLSFSNLDAGINYVFTGSAIFKVNCAQIPDSGVNKTVNNIADIGFGKNHSVHQSFSITSTLSENLTTMTAPSELYVGTLLFWIIESEIGDFDMRPEECWAYAGMAVLDNVTKKYLINDGCTLDEGLVREFQWHDSANGSMVWAVFFTFKFFGSDYVTLQCKVRVCPRPSDACIINCDGRKKRRRADNSDDEPAGGITRDQADDIDNSGTYRLTTTKVRVIDAPYTLMSESASIESECIWLVLVWLVLKIL
ncbi:uncharacterized protein LOC123561172 isoform X2 [Mercenaria mercenaria]|uniref:uncharacterized protein LOC123561172 isoform X2 n=1 Tax=Mercenaria mercenaria TaxID=6596 RepID=UPI00234F3903|nr:uncharacterized protein LOC123561172 isoform X2 [Mercenaria mercenaria]